MVEVLIILDGASEPLGPEPTSLERASTPTLDALGREGSLSRLRTVAPNLSAGSEAAIPALLGWRPHSTVDRAALELAAREIELDRGERPWRVDVVAHDGGRPAPQTVSRAAVALANGAPGHRIHRIGGHRLLVTGAPPLPTAAHAPGLRAWPEGLVPPRVLGEETVVIAAPGAASGCARLLGANVVNPPGATGRPDSDLAAKADAARAAIASGARRVVVHVGAPDEASHERDPAAKVAAIERVDADLVAAVAAAVRDAGGSLSICPDHGCDPLTGEHDAHPVPHLRWPDPTGPSGRLTERDVRELPVVELAPA